MSVLPYLVSYLEFFFISIRHFPDSASFRWVYFFLVSFEISVMFHSLVSRAFHGTRWREICAAFDEQRYIHGKVLHLAEEAECCLNVLMGADYTDSDGDNIAIILLLISSLTPLSTLIFFLHVIILELAIMLVAAKKYNNSDF